MPGNQIKTDLDTAAMGLPEQRSHVRIRAVTGRYHIIISDIVTRILKRRNKTGIQPYCVHTKRLNIIQFADYSSNIANSIPVGIAITLRINLIKYRII
jgi:hypothetical protein